MNSGTIKFYNKNKELLITKHYKNQSDRANIIKNYLQTYSYVKHRMFMDICPDEEEFICAGEGSIYTASKGFIKEKLIDTFKYKSIEERDEKIKKIVERNKLKKYTLVINPNQ